ncbi:arylsulfatase [Jiulongibacter sp. NS-SX5]|uniref:arylsulfatase n=1 Tax=Jiulongibacter sp. NS-SX5 TaxID=3463854 RepID=UPI004059B99F
MKYFKSLLYSSALLLLLSCKETKQPNVLFILTDDQGWGDMSSHGNVQLETPTLDKLASQGAEFENFYVSPLCAPTRASLLTGRYHLRTGATSVSNGLEILDSDESTIAELFKSNGYQTGIFGKWHNGSHYPNRPTDQGFDEFIGFCAGHWSNYFDTHLDSGTVNIETEGYITDVLTEKAIDFIERNKSNPFLCYVPYNAPHSPYQVPDPYFEKYKNKGLDDELATVYGMVENIDDNIARLLQKLDDTGLSDNTIVIFMTDNGPNGYRYNGHMKGIKGHVDEGGVRVPALIKWSEKIAQGKKIKDLAAHIDLYPTLQKLCKLKPIETKPLDGIDLSDLLLGNTKKLEERSIFSHVAFLEKDIKARPGALRTSQYRFVIKNEAELYDMTVDPEQKNNIALQEQSLTKEFKTSYLDWFKNATLYYQAIKPIEVNTSFTELPTYEAEFLGNLKFEEGHGWAHDWLVNWSSEEDQIKWLVKSSKEVTLKAFIKYTCPKDQTGSTVKLSIDKNYITSTLEHPFDPPLLISPDRLKRKEAYEKNWTELALGEITIPAGEHYLVLSADNIVDKEVAELFSLILRK